MAKKEKKITNWQKQLKQEFSIHFKDTPDELQFLEVFISDLIRKEYKKGYRKGFLNAKK